MALTDDNSMVMPVAPMYGNGGSGFGNGFGGDGWWVLLLILLLGNNAWGGGFGGWGGGMGGFAADGAALYPWMNQAEVTQDGFRDQMINGGINSIRDVLSSLSTQLCGCCGDIQNSLCNGFANTNLNVSNGFAGVNLGMANGFAGVNQTLNNGFSQAEIAANGRQMANINQAFAAQTAMSQGFNNLGTQTLQGFNQLGSQFADCCCENRLGLADLKYTVATENCADRTQSLMNTRDIIDSQTRGTQAILDKLCALELDGVKGQLAQAQRENVALQNQVNMASFRESQANQNALFAQGLNNEVDALYNRLKNCPVNTVPVAGNTPLFSCNPGFNNGGGCGCNGGFAN